MSIKRCIIAGFFSAKDKDKQLKIDEVALRIKSLGGSIVGTIVQRRGASRSKKPGGSKLMNEPQNAKYIFSKVKLQELIDLSI